MTPLESPRTGDIMDYSSREPRLDDAQVAKVCAVAKELRA